MPTDWGPNYEMNQSISLYWRNGTGLEPAEYYDGYEPLTAHPSRTPPPTPPSYTPHHPLHMLSFVGNSKTLVVVLQPPPTPMQEG